MSESAHNERTYKEADALNDPHFPDCGEIVVGSNNSHGVVVGGIKQPAGRMVINGHTLAELLEIRDERACVWVAPVDGLEECYMDVETTTDALDAVRADAIYPTPVATTMIAPTDVGELAEVLG